MRKNQPKTQGETSEERIAAFKSSFATFFWKPYPWQWDALGYIRKYNTIPIISSNKIGKTAFLVNLLISWALGYEPWNPVDKDHPEAVPEKGGVFYHSSSLGIKPPVNLIITGEDWKLHIGRTLIPEMKKWAPEGWYRTKKNEQGVEYLWEWENHSTHTIMSYSQDDDLFESFRAQGVGLDEPPPRSKYAAMSRGLLLDCGKTVLSLTPLKEPWILDELVLSGRRDVGVVDRLMITDNPDLLESDLSILNEMGMSYGGKTTDLQEYCRSKEVKRGKVEAYFDLLLYEDKEKGKCVSDKGASAEKYLEKHVADDKIEGLSKLKILKFIKDIDPSDVPPRVFGEFKALVGRVLKKFDDDVHVIEPFEVPTDWPVTVMIDFHLSTPQAVSYWAVNPQQIHYGIAETWKNLDADGIADDIVRKIRNYGWEINDAYIDPLSKGDTAYMRNIIGTDVRDTFSILEERLDAHGIELHVASKDKDSGVKNIQTWIEGPNKMPTVYLFNTLERHIYETKRWVFDDDGKPTKDCSDHFMENWYRYTLTGAKYEYHAIKPIPQPIHHQQGAWMGA